MQQQLTISPNGLPLNTGADVHTAIQAFALSQDVKASSRALYARTLGTFFEWVATSEWIT